MIKQDFLTKEEAKKYLTTEVLLIKDKKSTLSRSERDQIPELLLKPELLVIREKEVMPKGLPIITDREVLKQPSAAITPDDDIKFIIKALKDTMAGKPNSIGLSAPQIGIQKRVSYIKVPVVNQETKSVEIVEKIIINPVITSKSGLVQLRGEGCCSFPGVKVNTERYIFITLEYLDENQKPRTCLAQDLEAFAIQHEVDHLNGILLFDRKHKAR